MFTSILPPEVEAASGPINLALTNDFFFRALLQKNNTVLQGLIASLLHLDFDSITSVEIANEVALGELPLDKVYILDIHVRLNNNTDINLEMQVFNTGNWPERSISYLSRSFSNLQRGDDYQYVKPAIHIGFLDFTLFEDAPEFYATYYLMNEKNHRIYSDKFRLSVVDLTQINLATDEDKAYGIDQWASFFKSTTWEELKMLAQKNQAISEAVSTTYMLYNDEVAKGMFLAREESLAYERHRKQETLELKATVAEQQEVIAEQQEEIAEQKEEITEYKAELAEKTAEILELKKLLAERKK